MVRRLGDDEPEDNVSKLRIKTFPDFEEVHDLEYYAALYRWHYSHPAADRMYRWVAVSEEGEVVGHLSALPQFYRVGGERLIAHTPGDYMVLPGYSFQAFSLMRAFFKATENCVACDMVPAVIGIETRLGAEVAGDLRYAAKLLNVSRLPVPSVPEPVRRMLGFPRRFTSARGYGGAGEGSGGPGEQPPAVLPPRPRAPIPAPLKTLLNRGLRIVDELLSRVSGSNLEVEEVGAFDETFDGLFEEVAAAVPCVPEKDAAFLTWRYGPDSPQYPVEVLGVRRNGRLFGYAVLKATTKGQDGYILDLMALPGHPDVSRALLRESVRYFRAEGVEIIRYRYLESPTSPRSGDLRRLGFFHRKGRTNSLLVRFADGRLHDLGRNLDNWSYNVGDGEATFWIR